MKKNIFLGLALSILLVNCTEKDDNPIDTYSTQNSAVQGKWIIDSTMIYYVYDSSVSRGVKFTMVPYYLRFDNNNFAYFISTYKPDTTSYTLINDSTIYMDLDNDNRIDTAKIIERGLRTIDLFGITSWYESEGETSKKATKISLTKVSL